MLSLASLAEQIVTRRKALGLNQTALAKNARVSRSTIDALENGRLGELGFTKINNILAALGLELTLRESPAPRPTLEDLMAEETEEEHDDQGLDRRR
jgi:transcriptional regulator with XRE-family HTH domain